MVTRANAEQVAMRRSAVANAQAQLQAVGAQRTKADSSYTNILAPLDGIVDVRAARQGEVVNPGQPIVSLINPDDYWVRADVEETYVDRVRIGDTFTVRLPSGDERTGTAFYRRADASLLARRDRTKRDITFGRDARRQRIGGRVGMMTSLLTVTPRKIDEVKDKRQKAEETTGPAMNNGISVQHIGKVFGTFTAVDDISFTVEPGEVFGLLGPNGAGKSTLIRMLTTLLPPTRGTAVVGGFDIVKQPDSVRRTIGVIPQAMTSDTELSVEENLIIFAKLYG